MKELDAVYPPAPLFYLSYARPRPGAGTGREANRAVIRFFYDLSENVAQLTPRSRGTDPGFIARSMKAGLFWTDELLHAVGTCEVFVALLSAPYTSSSLCAMEWDAFSRRKVTRKKGSNRRSAIIPVIWAPYPDDITPDAIHRVDRFSPSDIAGFDAASSYERNGIFGLLHSNDNAAYQLTVWKLAQKIVDLHYSQSVEPRTPILGELRDIFQEHAS